MFENYSYGWWDVPEAFWIEEYLIRSGGFGMVFCFPVEEREMEVGGDDRPGASTTMSRILQSF